MSKTCVLVCLVWFLGTTSTHAVTTGLCYSGGGITGILSAMCAQKWIQDEIPDFDSDLMISTASGGTLGYLLHEVARDHLEYPPSLRFNLTYAELKDETASTEKRWWGTVVKWLPHLPSSEMLYASQGLNSSWGPHPNCRSGWWQDVMKVLYKLYGLSSHDVETVNFRASRWAQNFAVLEQKACPVKRDDKNVWTEAEQYLHHAFLEAVPGNRDVAIDIEGGLTIDPKSCSGFTLADGAAYSSFFLASSIVESKAAFYAERAAEFFNKGILVSAIAQPSDKWVYLVDGGFIDTTGIVSQLKKGVKRIFAIYVCNDCLKDVGTQSQCQTASFAYLFGQNVKTDDMNSISGPEITQVFDSSLYTSVMTNLTNPQKLLVRLQNVEVKANKYLGVDAYILDELMILSNMGSSEFVDSFTDPNIKQNLDADWPDRFSVSMNAFNANMMCEYQRWKLDRHSEAVKSFFQSGKQHVMV